MASSAVEKWHAAGRMGFYWGALAPGRSPGSWTDSAEGRLAAGLQITDREAILHTDALGMQELYIRRHGKAIYFSVRMEPLLGLDDSALHTDWSAWADILAVTCPLGEATPFQEVRRLAAASAYRADADGVGRRSFEPAWMAVEPDPTLTPAATVDAVANRLPSGRRAAIMLSGGWDSRLLALLVARSGRRAEAWTISKDDGHDLDLELAKPVAVAMRLRHHVIDPGPEAWLDDHTTVNRRLGFQTSHHVWMMPLVRALRRRSDLVLDGLAGDVFFRGLSLAKWESVAAPSPGEQRHLIWAGLQQNRLRRRHLYAPGVACALEEMSRASFDLVTGRFDGHPDSTTLSVLHTRTARAISLAPQWLLAPEVDVHMPFVHPDVMRIALSVPISHKVGDNFYRAMLHAADPAIAGLPSTNDDVRLGKTGYMRQTSPNALRSLATSILAREEVARLLSSDVRRALKDPEGLMLIGRAWPGLYLLQWAGMLADWRATYGSRLADNEHCVVAP